MKLTPLIDHRRIQQRVEELGLEISADYAECQNLVLVCILRGSFVVFADLIRQISLPFSCEFIQLESYGSRRNSSGSVKIISSSLDNIGNSDILVIEDIVDTGLSITVLYDYLLSFSPFRIKLCSLLDKPSRRQQPISINYVGFSIENQFVVGYGLDYDQLYRNLPDICVLDLSKP